MVRKMTNRFNMDNEIHRMAVEILLSRNRMKYKALEDYMVPAVLSFANQKESGEILRLSEQDKRQIIAEIVRELDRKYRLPQEPGI